MLKAIKDLKPVLWLGIGCGSFNVVFHLIRRLFALKRKAMSLAMQKSLLMSQESELFWACSVGSLALHLAPANDIRIFKVVIFSRAVSSFVRYLGDSTGWFKPVEHHEKRKVTVEYVLAVSACFFLVYCYIFQPNSMSKSLMNTITRGLHLDDNEKRVFECLRAIHELEGRLKR